MTTLVVMPIVIPAAAAAACLLAWRDLRLQRAVAVLGAAVLLVVAVALFAATWQAGTPDHVVGDWGAGVGIRLRADVLAATMLVAVAALAVAVTVFALATLPDPHVAFGGSPLIMLLVMGTCGVILTSDLFNLYVWLEVLLMASFVLVALGGRRRQLHGGTVYVVLNLIASSVLLIAIGLTYGLVHALDLDVVRDRLAAVAATHPDLVLALEAMLVVALGVKAAVVPLGFWLPIAYPTPIPAVTALFTCLAEIGVYALIRVVVGVFPSGPIVYELLAAIAIVTILVGTVAGIVQTQIRAIVSFLDVGHIGYMVAGLAIASAGALAATTYYLVHHLVVTANLFLIAGAARRLRRAEDLRGLGGLARREPLLAAAFAITGLSLAGVPPLSGFWAKLAIVDACLASGRWWLAAAAIAGGVVTLVAVIRIWNAAFAGSPRQPEPSPASRRERAAVLAPIAGLAAATVALGVAPGPAFEVCRRAAAQVLGGPG